mmetsp:Transcript_13529/g.20361  ORF Transcript_13529/g.20361 Transcript_13529/m.20361 type:complete len:85 (-) Transcript_13529:654-908(-)
MIAPANKPAVPISEAVTRRPGSIAIDHTVPINALTRYNSVTNKVPRVLSNPVIEPPTTVLSAHTCKASCKHDAVSNNAVKILHH